MNDFIYTKQLTIKENSVYHVDISLDADFMYKNEQSNTEILEEIETKNITKPKSNELVVYRSSDVNKKVDFYFNQINNYNILGFTSDNIARKEPIFDNSFYIIEYYDNTDPNKQIKYYTNFFKPVIDINTLKNNVNDIKSYYTFNNKKKDSLVYIPERYVTGDTQTIYVKFRYFNAKNGKVYSFKVRDKSDEPYYGVMTLNNVNKTFSYNSNTLLDSTLLLRYNQENNTEPINFINNTKENAQYISQDGTYIVQDEI